LGQAIDFCRARVHPAGAGTEKLTEYSRTGCGVLQ
jgi:hypothetical protein